MRGETRCSGRAPISVYISIHSPHARGDLLTLYSCQRAKNFNPLPSCEGRPENSVIYADIPYHFNPLPSCEGRPDPAYSRFRFSIFQSTPLMRGETSVISAAGGFFLFQSTPLMRGETPVSRYPSRGGKTFQSTPLMRGETAAAAAGTAAGTDFNPLPSCEGRQHKPLKIRLDSRQSIQQKHHISFF